MRGREVWALWQNKILQVNPGSLVYLMDLVCLTVLVKSLYITRGEPKFNAAFRTNSLTFHKQMCFKYHSQETMWLIDVGKFILKHAQHVLYFLFPPPSPGWYKWSKFYIQEHPFYVRRTRKLLFILSRLGFVIYKIPVGHSTSSQSHSSKTRKQPRTSNWEMCKQRVCYIPQAFFSFSSQINEANNCENPQFHKTGKHETSLSPKMLPSS